MVCVELQYGYPVGAACLRQCSFNDQSSYTSTYVLKKCIESVTEDATAQFIAPLVSLQSTSKASDAVIHYIELTCSCLKVSP